MQRYNIPFMLDNFLMIASVFLCFLKESTTPVILDRRNACNAQIKSLKKQKNNPKNKNKS